MHGKIRESYMVILLLHTFVFEWCMDKRGHQKTLVTMRLDHVFKVPHGVVWFNTSSVES